MIEILFPLLVLLGLNSCRDVVYIASDFQEIFVGLTNVDTGKSSKSCFLAKGKFLDDRDRVRGGVVDGHENFYYSFFHDNPSSMDQGLIHVCDLNTGIGFPVMEVSFSCDYMFTLDDTKDPVTNLLCISFSFPRFPRNGSIIAHSIDLRTRDVTQLWKVDKYAMKEDSYSATHNEKELVLTVISVHDMKYHLIMIDLTTGNVTSDKVLDVSGAFDNFFGIEYFNGNYYAYHWWDSNGPTHNVFGTIDPITLKFTQIAVPPTAQDRESRSIDYTICDNFGRKGGSVLYVMPFQTFGTPVMSFVDVSSGEYKQFNMTKYGHYWSLQCTHLP